MKLRTVNSAQIMLVRPLAGKMPLLLLQLLLLVCCCCHQRRPAAESHYERRQAWLHNTKEPAASPDSRGEASNAATQGCFAGRDVLQLELFTHSSPAEQVKAGPVKQLLVTVAPGHTRLVALTNP